MKIYIGPYRDWFGPYQIADLLQKVGVSEDKCHDIGEWLADKTPLSKICEWIHSKRNRKVKIRIDKYDTWNMDSTLAYIILPMLKQLNATKHGSPLVDDDDVPEELRSTNAPPKENDWDTDENHFKRWDWVINEMIWAFEQLHPDNDWEDQYHSGNFDFKFEKKEGEDLSTMVHGPDHTHKFDSEGYMKHSERIDAGLKLFGKYYRGLWD